MSYEQFVQDLARFPKAQNDPHIVSAMYCALGLAGEAGEVVEKVKKWHRDGRIDKQAVALELGDVLYYLVSLGLSMGYTLADIERMNVEKLESRRQRNQIHGNGDNR